jgi:hypothetical protein
MPCRTPKVYFADHCRATTNFVLITERVPFAVGTFERAHDKYLDRFLPRPPAHYYLVLMQQLGRQVGGHSRGAEAWLSGRAGGMTVRRVNDVRRACTVHVVEWECQHTPATCSQELRLCRVHTPSSSNFPTHGQLSAAQGSPTTVSA